MNNFLEDRLKICKQCPLYKISSFGPICDPKKYINPKTNEFSYLPKDEYIKGCNCRLQQKAANINNHCVAGKW